MLLLAVSGNLDDGLVQMANYLGNVILPIAAGLVLCIGVFQLAHKARSGEHFLTAAMVCLMASGFVRLAEYFSTQGSGQDQFYAAFLSLTNWVANVVLPLYAGLNLVRGILSVTGSFEFTSMGGNTARHFLVAVSCLSISGGLRLLEWFVTTGAGGLH